jgi:ubiquinone/menaquinone biosynthesis C-methylase UbiE
VQLSKTLTEEYWSRFPDTYDGNQEYVAGRLLLDAIKQELNRLPDLGELVELGCGTGYFTEIIAARAEQTVATDLSDILLDRAGKRISRVPNVKIQREDGMATSFAAATFDSVFMANLIHVVEHPGIVLQECHRILKDNGLLVIVTFTGHGMNVWEKLKMGMRFAKVWGRLPAHTNSFSPDDLAEMMENAGFRMEISKLIGRRTRALFAVGRKANGSA